MKKFISIFMALLIVASLVSCVSKNNNEVCTDESHRGQVPVNPYCELCGKADGVTTHKCDGPDGPVVYCNVCGKKLAEPQDEDVTDKNAENVDGSVTDTEETDALVDAVSPSDEQENANVNNSVVTNYSWDEISASEGRVIDLGEDILAVVGEYNDDFSEIVISQNTVKSNGQMRGFSRVKPETAGNKNLVSAVIQNGVRNVGYGLFVDCENLKNVTIPASVTNIDDFAFCGCKALSEIVISNSVTVIGAQAFAGTAIAEINIPASVTELGPQAFLDCSSLKTINFEASEAPSWFNVDDLPNVVVNFNVEM